MLHKNNPFDDAIDVILVLHSLRPEGDTEQIDISMSGAAALEPAKLQYITNNYSKRPQLGV